MTFEEVKVLQEAIYFSKIEYREYIGSDRLNILFLNLKAKELSYQVFKRKQKAPVRQTSFL